MTQNNLGNAYRALPTGDRAANLEQAISHYQQALEVFTRQTFPEDWALTQNNLANAYHERIQGERADNLEQAISHYQQALKIYTRQAFPQDWALTQHNLANTYLQRIRGERADSLEQAILHCQQALEVRTRQAFPRRLGWDAAQSGKRLPAAHPGGACRQPGASHPPLPASPRSPHAHDLPPGLSGYRLLAWSLAL